VNKTSRDLYISRFSEKKVQGGQRYDQYITERTTSTHTGKKKKNDEKPIPCLLHHSGEDEDLVA